MKFLEIWNRVFAVFFLNCITSRFFGFLELLDRDIKADIIFLAVNYYLLAWILYQSVCWSPTVSSHFPSPQRLRSGACICGLYVAHSILTPVQRAHDKFKRDTLKSDCDAMFCSGFITTTLIFKRELINKSSDMSYGRIGKNQSLTLPGALRMR